jgi:hypothetical protein
VGALSTLQQSSTSSFGIHQITTFWKTLYCDVDDSINDEAELYIWHGKFLGDLKSLGRGEALSNLRVSDLINCTSRRVFGRTTKGIGFFPEDVEVGDKIAMFYGASAPFILRLSLHDPRDDAYELVGPCYVLGLMNLDMKSLERSEVGEILVV